MHRASNMAGGETIWLEAGESLDQLPPAHRALIAPELQTAFAAPQQYFQQLAESSTLSGFQALLSALVTRCRCALVVATTDEMFSSWARGTIGWPAHRILIEPGPTATHLIPRGFEALASQVRWIHWDDIGCSGGLFHFNEGHSALFCDCTNDRFPFQTTRVFGLSSCGDMLIYNADGEAGYMSHETGEAYSLGSVTDALNWIFDELRQGRTPEFDYARVK